MATVGALRATLSLNSMAFTKGTNAAGGSARRFGDTIGVVGAKVRRFAGLLITAAGGAGLAVMVRQSMKTIDELGKVSDMLDITTEDLQTLQHAAVLTGGSVQALNKGLRTFAKNVGEATLGYSEASEAIATLGLTAEQLARAGIMGAMMMVADKMSAITNATQRASIASDLFSKRQMILVNMLAMGSAKLGLIKKDLGELGVLLSRPEAKAVEKANDAISRMQLAVRGLVNSLTVALAPALETTANLVSALVKWWNALSERARFSIVLIGSFATALLVAIPVIAVMVKSIAILIGAYKALAVAQTLVAVLSGPAGWMVLLAAVAAAGGAVLLCKKAFGGLSEEMKRLQEVMKEAKDASRQDSSALVEVESATEKARASTEKWVRSLEQQAETFGMTARAAEMYKRAGEGGFGPGMITRAREAIAALEELEAVQARVEQQASEHTKLESRFKSLWEAAQTPLEKYQGQMDELHEMVQRGIIRDMEVFDRLAQKAMGDLASSTRSARDELVGLAKVGTAEAVNALARHQMRTRAFRNQATAPKIDLAVSQEPLARIGEKLDETEGGFRKLGETAETSMRKYQNRLEEIYALLDTGILPDMKEFNRLSQEAARKFGIQTPERKGPVLPSEQLTGGARAIDMARERGEHNLALLRTAEKTQKDMSRVARTGDRQEDLLQEIRDKLDFEVEDF